MCLAWVILQIAILFFYKNLHEFVNNETLETNPSTSGHISINNQNINANYGTLSPAQNEMATLQLNNDSSDAIRNLDEDNEMNHDSENERLIKNANKISLKIVDNSESGPFLVRLYNEYIREEVVAVLCSTFCVFLMQTALEVFRFFF